MDRNSDIDRGKKIDMVDTVYMVLFRYFSLMSISFRSQKITVSLRSETSETNPLFRFEAKFFSLLFSHRFALKRNERRTLVLSTACDPKPGLKANKILS
jgi:hypothetical protein